MVKTGGAIRPQPGKVASFGKRVKKDFKKNWVVYLMVLPVVVFYIMFHYIPMYGAQIAFRNFRPIQGIWGSDWVGLEHLTRFFQGPFFFRLMRNTFMLNVHLLFWGFPAPIILALLMNEVRVQKFKRTVQTITYMPFFISAMVVAGIIMDFTLSTGIINDIIVFFGGSRRNLLADPSLFRPIFVIQSIWQNAGWGTIVYLAALAGIDEEQYEAAMIDGAGRFRRIFSITIPGILPTIVIMLILRMGSMMTIGFEMILLLYQPATYETADVISTYVYRVGLLQANFSFATAVGLFNSVLNFALIVMANAISKRVNETSLW
ncbi:MAG: ABC transporter permease subunit [Defluviitaleaceae bacterium]|nr:ABC transporter permease subunit [Defluviitaleaceae bacterium]